MKLTKESLENQLEAIRVKAILDMEDAAVNYRAEVLVKYVYGVFRLDRKLVVGKVSERTAWGSSFASTPLCGYQSTAAEAKDAYRLMCRRKLELAKVDYMNGMEAMVEVREGALSK